MKKIFTRLLVLIGVVGCGNDNPSYIPPSSKDTLTIYYKNGNIKSKGLVTNKLYEGEVLYFDSLTRLLSEIKTFSKGVPKGYNRFYNSKGRLIREESIRVENEVYILQEWKYYDKIGLDTFKSFFTEPLLSDSSLTINFGSNNRPVDSIVIEDYSNIKKSIFISKDKIHNDNCLRLNFNEHSFSINDTLNIRFFWFNDNKGMISNNIVKPVRWHR